MYSEKVMDHFMNPRNVGDIPEASGVGQVGNPRCGDIMKMYLKIENDIITDARFKTFGCGAAVATSSMATELIRGKTVTEALQITNKTVAEALDGLPSNKMHCSNLAEEAIRAALCNYYDTSGKDYPEGLTDCHQGCGKCCDHQYDGMHHGPLIVDEDDAEDNKEESGREAP